MIIESTMWQVQCDRCGLIFEHDCIVGWASSEGANLMAMESEWIHIDWDSEVHSCPDCWTWDEEENEKIFKPGIIIKTGVK